MDPQQELFTALLVALRNKGYDVEDGMLPPSGATYPFVYLADVQELDSATKGSIFGDVVQTVHVWHDNVRERGTVSRIMADIKATSRELTQTDGFGWSMPANSVNQRIIPDNTTAQPLLHGIMELTFRFS